MAETSRLGVSYLGICFGCLLAVGLLSCGVMPDRSGQYKTATQAAPLKIPQGLQATQVEPLFGVEQAPVMAPSVNDVSANEETIALNTTAADTTAIIPRPARMQLSFGQAGARVQRAHDRDQLIIESPPKQLAQRIIDFFELRKGRVEQRRRVLLVDWARYDDQGTPKVGWFTRLGRLITLSFMRKPKPNFYQLRFTINEIKPDMARIGLAYRVRRGEKMGRDIPWETQLKDDETLARVLGELVEFIEREPERDARALTSVAVLSTLESDANGFPVWVINQSFARAWENLLITLRKTNFEIEDLDRSLGLFYIKSPDLSEALAAEDNDEEIIQLRVVNAERGVLVSTQLSDEVLLPKAFSLRVLNQLKSLYSAQN